MPFLHEDEEFEPLIRIVAAERHLAEGIIEKDYWVTHSLWALQQTGLAISFKGGTSLSMGFGFIERFSEDVDLTIGRGTRTDLPDLRSLTTDTPRATASRRAFFEALAPDIPGIPETQLISPDDGRWISVQYEARYSRRFTLPGNLRPFVLLEPGLRPWKPPTLARDITSLVHRHVARIGLLGQYTDNRALAIECVHPFVTLIDKLDAITKRYSRDPFAPEDFIRHYEDVAHLVSRIDELEALDDRAKREVITQCVRNRDIRPDDPAFVLGDRGRRAQLERAHSDIEPMFWGPRVPLGDCGERIAKWLQDHPFPPANPAV